MGSSRRRPGLAAGALALAGLAAWTPAVRAAPQVQIRGAAVQVAVVPEDRKDIRIVVLRANPRLPLRIRKLGERVTVSGDVSRRIHGCGPANAPRIAVWSKGVFPLAALPYVVVRVPRAVHVLAGDAVFGVIGRSDSVELENVGCGTWKIADTRGRLRIEQAGSGDIGAGPAGAADLTVAGDGRIAVGQVAHGLTAVSSGSGDVLVGEALGPADLRVGGSGNVVVLRGRIGALTASIAGSGDVRVGATAATLAAQVMGSGDIQVTAVQGAVSRRIFGSGHVRVGS